VVSPKSKLTKQVKKPKATWVEPSFFADVEYRDVTSKGLLRQSSFKGLTKLRKEHYAKRVSMLASPILA
jgi:bifunctional non-homologous end joining protein LigD